MGKEEVWQWGLQVIASLQEFRNPLLDALMRVITLTGTEEAYVLLICFLLWCGHPSVGLRLAGWLAFAGFINADLKNLFAHPRPFEFVPQIQLIPTSGYGFPSGHAQLSVVVWGYLAARTKLKWFRRFTVVCIVLIGLSRVYLGVHFPSDVLAGWFVGLLLLLSFLAFESLPLRKVRDQGRLLSVLGLVLAVAAVILFPVVSAAKPLGLLVAFALVVLFGKASWNGNLPERVKLWRFLVGLSGVIVLETVSRVTLLFLLSDSDSSGPVAGTFGAGFLLGIWLFRGSFMVFQKLGLIHTPDVGTAA